MTFASAAAIGGAIVGSAIIGGYAANKAANTQADAANRAADLQMEQFKRQTELQEPFRQAGLAGQNRLLELLGLSQNKNAVGYGSLMRPFSMADFQADPGYNFRLREGLSALDKQAAARGGLISGNSLRAAQDYGQNLASEEFQNAFNRYQVNRANQLQPLQSLTGAGQSTVNALGEAGGQMARGVGEAYQGAANARASGYMGMANALTGGLGTYLNYQQGQNMINALNNRNAMLSRG